MSYRKVCRIYLEKCPNGWSAIPMDDHRNSNNNNSLFSQASWGRLEMKPEKNKFKVQAH